MTTKSSTDIVKEHHVNIKELKQKFAEFELANAELKKQVTALEEKYATLETKRVTKGKTKVAKAPDNGCISMCMFILNILDNDFKYILDRVDEQEKSELNDKKSSFKDYNDFKKWFLSKFIVNDKNKLLCEAMTTDYEKYKNNFMKSGASTLYE